MLLQDRVAHFADIDTRRAMGYPPRRLQIDRNKILHPGLEFESFKFYSDRNTLIYFSRLNWDHMEMEVTNNVRFDFEYHEFVPLHGATVDTRTYRSVSMGMQFAGQPVFV